MKVTKTYPITTEYVAVVEIEDVILILYIEKVKKVFFGWIDWNDRVSPFRVFTMGGIDENMGVDIQRMIHGYLGHYPTRKRNIDTFDIEVEISKMYNDYLNGVQLEKERDEKLNNFINKL